MENMPHTCYNVINKVYGHNKMKKHAIIYTCFVIICISLMLFCMVACNDDTDNSIDYGKDNSFAVNVIEDSDALSFEPNVDCDKQYGLMLYVSTGTAPSQYTYLGNALAKQGYVVVIPKTQNDMPLQYYTQTECAFEKYPDTKFFIAGHSNQGAGACVRRSNECENDILGSILIAPILASTPVVDKDNNPVLDENENAVYKVNETLCDFTKPVLLIEGQNDKVRTQKQISEAKSALPNGSQSKLIESANHTAFAQVDDIVQLPIGLTLFSTFTDDVNATTTEQKQEQRTLTAFYIVEFMRNIVSQ